MLIKKIPIHLIFISILVIFLGYFSYSHQRPKPNLNSNVIPTSTPTPTSFPEPDLNWKTYSNSTLNLSFKYPPDYFKYLKADSSSIYLAPSKGVGGIGPKYLNKTDKWLEITIDTPVDIPSNADKKPITIDGMSGFEFHLIIPSNNDNLSRYFNIAWFNVNNHRYTITLNSWDEDIYKQSGVFFSQLLSTLKFSPTPLNTSSWKVFSLPKLFTLKYPSDLKYYSNAYDVVKLTKIPVCDPFNTSFCLYMSAEHFPNTNLQGAGLAIANLPAPQNISEKTCLETDKNFTDLGNQDIGTYNYHAYTRIGSAPSAGSVENIYYLFQNRHCFRITSRVITGANTQNNQSLTDNDFEAIDRSFRNIISTLKFF